MISTVLPEVISDALFDTLRILPFLFAAFLALEAIERYSDRYSGALFRRVGKAGPLVGAILGCIPQCGFSAAAANLYAGGLITLGTLLAVFLSTSDEALFILLAHPGSAETVLFLLAWKTAIGASAGFFVDLLCRGKKRKRQMKEICQTCGCHSSRGIVVPALRHTLRLSAYLFLFTFCLNLILAFVGTNRLAAFLGKDTLLQPFLAALLGMVPNCASSILITELYLVGSLSFGAAIAGLSSGAGIGLAVLFREGSSLRENIKIALLLYGSAAAAGLLLS